MVGLGLNIKQRHYPVLRASGKIIIVFNNVDAKIKHLNECIQIGVEFDIAHRNY